ncbi:MAG: MarR family transcriptional regulator [Thermoprotei archaeon]
MRINDIALVLQIAILLVIVENVLVSSSFYYSVSINSVIINIYYDVDANLGYVNQTVELSIIPSEIELVLIPLVKPPEDGKYEILSVKSDNGESLLFRENANNTLSVLVNNTKVVYVNYVIYNYAEELSPGLYIFYLDLMSYEGYGDFEVKLQVSRAYKVLELEPREGAMYTYSGDNLVITFVKPLIYIIALSLMEIEASPSTVPETPTQIPNNIATYNFILPLSIIAVSAIALTLYYLLRRRRIEIEEIPPSIIEDDTSKKIIEVIGDAGPSGIKQSELVSLTGRPKSSISRRVKKLAEEGYIEIIRRGKFNVLKLTTKGLEVYKNIKSRREHG